MSELQQSIWAIVELMGHRRRAGLVSEIERFGAKLLRLDIPHDEGDVTEFYGGSAIYALRPCAEDVARAAAEQIGDPRPISPLAYRLPSPQSTSDIDNDDELPF